MFQETNSKFKETDKRFQSTQQEIEKTQQQIRQMTGHFDKQLGKLVESLARYNTVKLFNEMGIAITHSRPNPGER